MCHPVCHSSRKLSSGDNSKIPLSYIKFTQWFYEVSQTLKTAASNDDIHLTVLKGVYQLSLQILVNKTPMRRCTHTIFVSSVSKILEVQLSTWYKVSNFYFPVHCSCIV